MTCTDYGEWIQQNVQNNEHSVFNAEIRKAIS